MMQEFDIGYPHSNVRRVLTKGFRTIRHRMAAAGLDREYYDGRRENGYGGFRYDGRWMQIVPRLAARYGLTSNSAVLDVGCKKGFFLHDLKQALPGVRVQGVENHPYPLECAMESVKADLQALREIQRVGKGQSFVTVGAYRTREGRELLEEWTLLGTTVLHVDEWLEVFRQTGYTGDYAFTTAESLNLVRG